MMRWWVLMVLLGVVFTPHSTRAASRPIVLLHGCCVGYVSDMADLQSRFAAQGYTVYNLTLPTDSDAVANAQYLAQQVSVLGQVDIVGFSLGGVSARYYAKVLGGSPHVASLSMIDSPNNGDFWGCFVSLSMCQGGSVIRTLNAGDDTPGTTRYQQLIDTDSGHSTYVLDGGVCLTPVSGVHNTLPHSQDVFNKVLAFVQGTCPGSVQTLPVH